MKEEKQIYAYSWRADIFNRVKKYFSKRSSQQPKLAPKPKTIEVKNDKVVTPNKKAVKQEKINVSKKTTKVSEPSFARKERREKNITYIIAIAIGAIFLTGVLMTNGIIKFPIPTSMNTIKLNSSTEDYDSLEPTTQISLAPTAKPYSPQTGESKVTPSQTICVVSGCNDEICSDESLGNISSICLYREKYSCLKLTSCERLPNGNCGWVENQEYLSCMAEYE